jgi:2-hydroxycyclohexanecarboxyl-CoA dehydrogenase
VPDGISGGDIALRARSDKPVAIVAGTTGPRGEAIAARLSSEGYRVATLDPQAHTGDLPIAVDVADRARMKEAADRVTTELGPVSVLVVAPEYHDTAPFGEMRDKRWQSLLRAHLAVSTSACAAVVPAMVRAGRGTVVTLSSRQALDGPPGEAYFAAATGSILAFTKSFAIEVARHGVRVNCIAAAPNDDVAGIADTVVFLINDGDFLVGQVFSPGGGGVV